MRRSGIRSPHNSDDLIQVVLDDETAARLRQSAAERGMEVEQLIVDLLHAMSIDLTIASRLDSGPVEGL